MRLSFHGAAREVTGSCHLLEAGGLKILLDCGMIQGGKERHERNREPFPFRPDEIDFVLLSHAHIDHSGRLPLLYKRGYKGPIICSAATRALSRVLLLDSGRIQEEDARWAIKRLKKKRQKTDGITALFTEEDAKETHTHFESVPFNQPLPLNDSVSVEFVPAGHILGAAILRVQIAEGGQQRTLVFSGDLGVSGSRLLGFPKPTECPDYLIMESTYGNRVRDPLGDPTEDLRQIITRTVGQGGKVIIPSFAVGRTQEILARINDLVERGRLPSVPVYVDSPMAVAATKVFAVHPEAYSRKARESLNAGDKPLEFPGLVLNTSVEGSIALNENRQPAVIISASGMCDAGRIKHHLKHNLPDHRSTIVFVGYQAFGSLGRVIQSGTNPVRIFGEYHPVRANIATIEGMSAHGDQSELQRWFVSLGGKPRKTFIVHGEEESALSLAGTLKKSYGADTIVPHRNESFDLD